MRPGQTVAGRFEIQGIAGSGGMGTVFFARDRATDERVALKVMLGHDDALARRFVLEASLLSDIRHPHIVRHVAHGVSEGGEQYLAMEWLEGETLAARLRTGPLSIDGAVALAIRVASALGVAHARGVVHRDLKPENLFLADGRLEGVKVLDFGIARFARAPIGLTSSSRLLGTPRYMAPEQVRGAHAVDARADVFALGAVLHECLAGTPAFVGEDVLAILAKILLEDTPRVRERRPDVPAALDELVARMLAKDPEARPRDGAATEEELGRLDRGGPVSADPPSAPRAITGSEQRLLGVVLLAAPSEAAPPSEPPSSAGPTPARDGGDPETVRVPVAAASDPAPIAPPPADVGVAPTRDAGGASPLGAPGFPPTLAVLRAAVGAYRGRIERLGDGAFVITLGGGGAATDQAVLGARCAASLRALAPEAPMSFAMGHGELAGGWPIGEVIDRAASLLRQSAAAHARGELPVPIRLDDAAAGLLRGRFDLGPAGGPAVLESERLLPETARAVRGRASPFVGRDRELAAVRAVLEECAEEPVARAVLVTAPAGMGKSRLRQELLGGLPASVLVWAARGDLVGAGSPFGLLAQMIRGAAGIADGEPLGVRWRKLRTATRTSLFVPGSDRARVTEFLAEVIGAPFPDARSLQLREARRDPVLMGDQLRRAWQDVLSARLAEGPCLLVLDDLHWGDHPSVKALDATLRAFSERPIMVLALARPEVHELFPGLWAERGVQEIRLAPLTARACRAIVRELLGSDDAALVDRAAGNPFYLEELVRAAGEGQSAQLPATILAMVQSRLDGLPSTARRVLRAASVFGQTFWRGAVAALLGGEAGTLPLADTLADLEELGVVVRRGERRFPAEEEYAFRHEIEREAAYASLTPSDRSVGHRLAGDWLERAGEVDAVVLAAHLGRGGEPERAARYLLRAARQALLGGDLAGAVAWAERAVAMGASGETLAALHAVQAEAEEWRGALPDAQAHALAALEHLEPGRDDWYELAALAAGLAQRLGQRERLVALAQQIAERPPGTGASSARIAATVGAAVFLLYDGHYAAAAPLFAWVDREAPDLEALPPSVAARVLTARAARAHFDGDHAEDLRLVRAAARSYEAAGDVRRACIEQSNAAFALIELGLHDEAMSLLGAALAAAERMGLPHVAATARHNLGLALARAGRLDEAHAEELRAAGAFAGQGDLRLEGLARTYLAEILWRRGELARAVVEADRAIDLLATVPPARCQALGVRARALLAQGEVAAALASAEEAMALFEELGGVEEGEALVRLVFAESLSASGQKERAAAAFATALARLDERASLIRDPELRRSFLESVPDNARTLELARL